MLKKTTVTIVATLFLVVFGGAFALSSITIQAFSDLGINHPNYTAIMYLANKGIINGYPDGTFKPGRGINRVEALKMILEANSIKTAISGTSKKFRDVQEKQWYSGYLDTGLDKSIINGYPDGTFKPEQNVNLAENLKMLTLGSGEDLSGIEIKINEWYGPYFAFAQSWNLIDTDKKDSPDKYMTRADLAEILYRFLIQKESNQTIIPAQQDTADTSTSTENTLTFNNSPKVGDCPIFSDQYAFNQRVDDPQKYPVLANSDTMIKNLELYQFNPMIATVGPVARIVDDTQPLIGLKCDPFISWCPNTLIGDETLMLPYPEDIFIVPGHDHHALIIQKTSGGPAGGVTAPSPLEPSPGENNCFLYETWWTGRLVDDQTPPSQPTTSYTQGSNVTGFTGGGLSIYDLKRDKNYVPDGIGGSSASNLPIAAGLVRYDEAINDDIRHALATAVSFNRYGYIAPANTSQFPMNCPNNGPTNQTAKALKNYAEIQEFPCDPYNVNLPATGQRFRLKADFDETPYQDYPISLAIIHALKKYGTIITDGSGGTFMWNAGTDSRWEEHQWPDMQQLRNLAAEDFEAIESGPITDMPFPPNIETFPDSSIYN